MQLVTDPPYKKLFCAFHPMVECMNSPATHFVRGRTRHQREFIYNIGRHDFDLMIHSNCIKTPYHLRIRMIEHSKTGNDTIKHSETKTEMFGNFRSEEIERVCMHAPCDKCCQCCPFHGVSFRRRVPLTEHARFRAGRMEFACLQAILHTSRLIFFNFYPMLSSPPLKIPLKIRRYKICRYKICYFFLFFFNDVFSFV